MHGSSALFCRVGQAALVAAERTAEAERADAQRQLGEARRDAGIAWARVLDEQVGRAGWAELVMT
jgi:hypothetical protein